MQMHMNMAGANYIYASSRFWGSLLMEDACFSLLQLPTCTLKASGSNIFDWQLPWPTWAIVHSSSLVLQSYTLYKVMGFCEDSVAPLTVFHSSLESQNSGNQSSSPIFTSTRWREQARSQLHHHLITQRGQESMQQWQDRGIVSPRGFGGWL